MQTPSRILNIVEYQRKELSMIKIYLFFIALATASLTSCINDDSTTGSNNVSEISLETPLNSTYTMNQGDTLRISPRYLQTNNDRSLTYQWEVNHQVVSTSPSLEYTSRNSGSYVGRLRVSNGDNIQIYEFNLNIEYAYTKGVYLLAEQGNRAILSYVPSSDANKRFHLDVLSENNPDINFGEPRSMAWNRTIGGQPNNILFVAAGNPSTIYQLDGYEMLAIFRTPANAKVNELTPSSNTGTPQTMVIADQRLYSLAVNSTNLRSQNARFDNALGYFARFANASSPWWRNDLFYAHGDAYFDNERGALLATAIETSAVPAEILPGTFTGDTLVGMGGVDRLRNLALITCQRSTGTFYLNHIFPGYFATTAARNLAPSVLYRIAMPASTGIGNGSVVRTAGSTNLIYYTAGNAVYAHNVLANNNFPTAPLFTVGNSSERIVDMVFSSDDTQLYVATNDPSAEMQGSLYCYDTQTNTLLWSQQHITGRIVKALYRNQ